MKVVLSRKDEHTSEDEHAVHEVRGYDVSNKLVFQQVATPGSKAESLGLDLYQSNRIMRIVIRCVFPLWPEDSLVKSVLCRGKAVSIPDGLDVFDYRVVYYGPSDYPAEVVDLDEPPSREAIRTYLRDHRHCPYAVVLAFNIPTDGEGIILDMVENPNFRVKKTIAALNDKSTKQDVLSHLNKAYGENAAKLVQEFKIEASITSARNLATRRTWGIAPPRPTIHPKSLLDRKRFAQSGTEDANTEKED